MSFRPAFLAACPLWAVLLAGCAGERGEGGVTLLLEPWQSVLKGSFDATGEAALAAAPPAGAFLVLGITQGRPIDFGVFDDSVTVVAPADTVRVNLRLRGLARGTYSIFLGVDLDRDGLVSRDEPGGYFDGSTLAPLREPAAARLFSVQGRSEPFEFGIGPAPAPPGALRIP